MPSTDAATWRALYESEYPRLVRALLAFSGDADTAEDAAWLLVVGGREALRQLRRRRREEPLPEREPGGATFEAVAERAERLAALRRFRSASAG